MAASGKLSPGAGEGQGRGLGVAQGVGVGSGADWVGSGEPDQVIPKGGGRAGVGRKINDADVVALAKMSSTKANT